MVASRRDAHGRALLTSGILDSTPGVTPAVREVNAGTALASSGGMTSKRPAGEDPWRVGVCTTCRVAFAGRPGEIVSVEHLLQVHERICPGGDRAGEIVMPLEASRPATPAVSLDD